MAEPPRPRPRMLAVAFGVYFLAAIGVAYVLSPTVAGYVMPSATFWISSAYVLLGSAVLLGIGVLGLRVAWRLDTRMDELLRLRRRAQVAADAAPAAPAPPVAVDSGSAEHEVDQLMAELQRVSAVALAEAYTGPKADDELAGFSALEALEMEELREVRDRVVVTIAGPAAAAAFLVGAFAPLLPAADGMLQSSLQLNAFVGVAGAACLVGVVAYAAAALRQLSRRSRA